MLKVMTIVGTRPELIKMSKVIQELDACTDHRLVHSGQNFDYELNQVFFEDLGIRRPDHFLDAAGGSTMQTIANILLRMDELLERERPDALMIYGDTNTGLAVIPAKRRKIPVFHMEAGNRCFDQRVPEELNRKVIDHLSDINIVLTEHARRYLLAEGIRPETIVRSGSHMPEVLAGLHDAFGRSDVLGRLGLTAEKYLVVSLHREENVDVPERLRLLVDTLERLAREFAMPVVVSTHPRTQLRLKELGFDPAAAETAGVRYLKPFGFFDYIALQRSAFCVLSDSGTITEESALLEFPAVNVREAHERPEGNDAGTTIMSGLTPDDLVHAVTVARRHHSARVPGQGRVPDYEVPEVSRKIVKLVLGYTGYVNRTVWRRS